MRKGTPARQERRQGAYNRLLKDRASTLANQKLYPNVDQRIERINREIKALEERGVKK